ncbi:MAG TPA: LuxR C-terminal-related transcriptional regulator [Symbiobacteriaceae bacterium]|nr:LuxR C-terminal-related transcriptional regulator [Symbiobacteriaceae bacterium]
MMDHTPLLTTKLFIPAPRVRRVVRDRLLDRLEAGKHRPLTLIAAPAGSGKTTLVSDWLAACPQPAAWLSLDSSENDPASFWRHLLAAIRRVWPDFGQDVLDLFQSPGPPALAAVAGLIVNELAGMDGRLTLVLDDYHVITVDSVHGGLAMLLESLPPQLRVVMLTRSDPPLPLPRMRAGDQLTEIRAADLRFTPVEAAAFLRDCMRLDLPDVQVQALAARTEGWIAGLQLAALAVQGDEHPQEFVDRFTGSHRFVLDYLTDEVLGRQPPDRLQFLLDTAVLDRLCGPLCDALTGDEGGQAVLQQLDQQNLFLVPLDDRRCWYRYHHLFRDVLRARLDPGRAAALQLRAAGWFEQQGLAAEAIPYALAAGDTERVAHLLEAGATNELFFHGEFPSVLKYLAALPQAVIAGHPWLIMHQAWATALTGNTVEASRMADVAAAKAAGLANGDLLLGEVAGIHAYRALLTGEFPSAVASARESLKLLPPANFGVRAMVAFTLASCSHLTGDLEEADRSYLLVVQTCRESGNISMGVSALMAQAEVLTASGRLQEAGEQLRKALRWVEEHGGRRHHLNALAFAGLGEVLREQGDLAEAERYLQEALERGRIPYGILRAHISLARLQGARGDFAASQRSLDAAVALMSRNQLGLGAALALLACAVQWHLVLGGAPGEVEEQLPGVDPSAAFLNEQEQIIRARLLLAQGRAPEARALLSRQAATARAGGRFGNWLAASVLELHAADAAGDRAAALDLLAHALTAAEPEGYARIFLDEGPPMVRLLEACGHSYASRLLGGAPSPPPARAVEQRLAEPLTDREREVLRLIAGGLTNPEIGARLYISEATVKRHVYNIFGKLEVTHRTQAVMRARELGLL